MKKVISAILIAFIALLLSGYTRDDISVGELPETKLKLPVGCDEILSACVSYGDLISITCKSQYGEISTHAVKVFGLGEGKYIWLK